MAFPTRLPHVCCFNGLALVPEGPGQMAVNQPELRLLHPSRKQETGIKLGESLENFLALWEKR